MSELLGRQDCIDSLRKDLVDLQGAILDVLSRTGPVRFSSWKFPDKLSCNLDMVALLEQYDFMDGEDAFNQHSHIVLLELLIDRLLLLLQSCSVFAEQMSGSYRSEQPQQKGCLSVGLVVRSYWSSLVQFANIKEICRDIKKQTKTFNCDETKTPGSNQISARSEFCRHCLSARSSASSFKYIPQSHDASSPTHNTPNHPVVQGHNVGCQTIVSSLIPCDACHQVQSILRKTGDALVDLLQCEGLPSSLRPLLAAVEDTLELGHMTAGDVGQWANEQLRDMRRLAKHVHDVRCTVQPLKDRLAAVETERERSRAQLEKVQNEFKQQIEKHQANVVQLEFSLHKVQRSMTETEQRLLEEQQQLKRDALSLEESNARLKEKVVFLQDTLQALECEKHVLQDKVKTLQGKGEACCELQNRVRQLESQISDIQLLLDKESAKYQSACRQQESMQAKQNCLLERVDALDEECEELQKQLGEREEQQINLHNELQQMSGEKEKLQAQLTQQQELHLGLEKEKQKLETQVSELKKCVVEQKEYVQGLKERERLLVAFPELTPLAQAQPQSTGNVFLDMEQQMQANSIRIKVLEQENAALRRGLEKLGERAQHNSIRETSPLQAWSVSPSSTPTEKQQNHLTQMQKSPLQSSSASRLGPSHRRKEARGGESSLESSRSEDRVSASPSSLHLQTIHLNTDSTPAKSPTRLRSTSLFSHSRGVNPRRK